MNFSFSWLQFESFLPLVRSYLIKKQDYMRKLFGLNVKGVVVRLGPQNVTAVAALNPS